jgi:hypothetical protein
MNKDQTAKWFKWIFAISVYIFFIAAIPLSYYIANKFLNFFTTDFYNLAQTPMISAAGVLRYAIIILFLVIATLTFARNPDRKMVALIIIQGMVTLVGIFIISVYQRQNTIVFFPTSGGDAGVNTIDKLTVYITTISGFLAALSGLYNQITSGKKAIAEIQLEKLRLQLEQEKAKGKSGKRKVTRAKK